MAVTIKKKALTLVTLVEKVFHPDTMLEGVYTKAKTLQEAGYVLSTTPTTFTITKDGMIYSSVAVKMDTVTLAMQGKVGTTVLSIVRQKVTDLIGTAFAKAEGDKVVENALGVANMTPLQAAKDPAVKIAVLDAVYKNGGISKIEGIKVCRNLTGLTLKEAKDLTEAWMNETGGDSIVDVIHKLGKFSVEVPQFESPIVDSISLREATKLHQPVHGTTSGAVYHVIALSADVKVAVRIKESNEVAIRVEIIPPNSTEAASQIRTKLTAAGMEKKTAGHYSLHLEPEDFSMVTRSIGSTLFSTGIPFDMVSTQLESLKGVGK